MVRFDRSACASWGALVLGVLVVVGGACPATAAIVAEDIAHHWAFEEGSGTVVDDRFSPIGDGMLLDGGGGQGGTVVFSSDAAVGSYALDFTGGMMNASGIGGWYNENFTISAWTKARSSGGGGYGYIAYGRDDARGFANGWAWHVNGNMEDLDANAATIGASSYITGGPATSTPPDAYLLNDYQHLVMSISPAVEGQVTLSLYLNGVLAGSQIGAAPTPGSQFLGFGNTQEYSTANNRWFDGLLDEVVIFKRELTAAEVEDFYTNLNGSVSGFEAPPVEEVDPWDGTPPSASAANLRLWLKAGAGTNNAMGSPAVPGEVVAQWQDRSSKGNHAAALGDAMLQSDFIDGKEVQVVNFSGDDYFETFLGQIAEPQWSMFAVIQQDATGNQKWIGYDEAADDTKVSWIGSGNGGNDNAFDFGINAANRSGIGTTGTDYHLYNIVYSTEAGVSTARLYLDGTLVSQFTSDQQPDLAFIVYDNLKMHVGKRAWDASGYLIGDIGELLFYDEALSAQQLNDVGAYLADQFHLTTAYLSGGSGSLDGDLDGDGFVGSSDLDIVRANWGQSVAPGTLGSGDPSGDGLVGSADLDIVRANWGRTAAAAVPEPGVLVLIALGGFCVCWRRG